MAAGHRGTAQPVCTCMIPGSWAAAELPGGRGYSMVLGEGRQHPGGANAVVHDYYSSVQVRVTDMQTEEPKLRRLMR